jgi:hypothetical protein
MYSVKIQKCIHIQLNALRLPDPNKHCKLYEICEGHLVEDDVIFLQDKINKWLQEEP